MDMNIDQSRRKLVKVAWATPVVLSVTLPAHAQTSDSEMTVASNTMPNTDLTCTIIADQNTIAAGGTITGIQTTVSPPTPGIAVLCTPTTTDPANPTLATAIATTDATGVASFTILPIPAAIAVGTEITLTDSLDVSDTSGLNLTPCTVTITVV